MVLYMDPLNSRWIRSFRRKTKASIVYVIPQLSCNASSLTIHTRVAAIQCPQRHRPDPDRCHTGTASRRSVVLDCPVGGMAGTCP